MTQARLIGENEASIPGNGRLDQSFPEGRRLGRYQVSTIQSGGIKDQQKVADTFARLKLIPEPIRVNDIVVNVGY
jgi:hypothetical protein